jgi:CheY-like chemotaxis protein
MIESSLETLTSEVRAPELPRGMRTSARSPIRVLVVEDDAETAELVHCHLTEAGDELFLPEWASGLVEAVIRLAQPGIDVILLDLGLPESSGYRSYRVIKSLAARNLPVVIFTADDRGISRDRTAGAADYLLKHENSPAQLRRALSKAATGH